MNNAVFVAIGAAAVLLAAFVFYQSKKRSADIRALAARIGFAYLSSELPNALVLPDDPFSKIGATSNVIDGEKDGIRVVAFDYRIGSGKGSWGGTVIAAQTAGTAFERLFSSGYTVDRAGEWTVFYQPRELGVARLISVAELEARINLI